METFPSKITQHANLNWSAHKDFGTVNLEIFVRILLLQLMLKDIFAR